MRAKLSPTVDKDIAEEARALGINMSRTAPGSPVGNLRQDANNLLRAIDILTRGF